MIIIQVFSKNNGNPKRGARVTIIWNIFTHTDCGYTDDNGCAYGYAEPGEGEVYVDGDSVYKGPVQGMIPVFA